jgi:hypothetical protein
MSKSGLTFARQVTREHGEQFAARWLRIAVPDTTLWEAVDMTRIITHDESDEAQARYDQLIREIIERTYAANMEHMVEAFLASARTVLKRERAAARRQGAKR